MKKMLAYVHAYVGHGRNAGAESTLHDMLKALVRTGEWEVDVQISKQDKSIPSPYTVDGVSVLPFRHRTDPNRLFPEYDVIITHLECSRRSAIIVRQTGNPLIQLVHNTMWQTEGYLNEGCDLAVFNTEWVRRHHTSQLEGDVVSTVVDNTRTGKSRVTLGMRRLKNWDSLVLRPAVNPADYAVNSTRHFITMVNMYEMKGPEVFWHLAAEFPDWDFLAVKGGYGEQVIPEKLPPNVQIWENQKNAATIYQQTKIILMPSDYESFGRIAVEAAASAIPSITTPTPGLVEALDYAGNFADRKDLPMWRKKLSGLLNSSDTYDDAAFAAKHRSEELWDQSKVELEDFIKRCDDLATKRGRNARR